MRQLNRLLELYGFALFEGVKFSVAEFSPRYTRVARGIRRDVSGFSQKDFIPSWLDSVVFPFINFSELHEILLTVTTLLRNTRRSACLAGSVCAASHAESPLRI